MSFAERGGHRAAVGAPAQHPAYRWGRFTPRRAASRGGDAATGAVHGSARHQPLLPGHASAWCVPHRAFILTALKKSRNSAPSQGLSMKDLLGKLFTKAVSMDVKKLHRASETCRFFVTVGRLACIFGASVISS